MVWFSEDAVTPDMFYQNHLKSVHSVALDAIEDNSLLIQPNGPPHFKTDGLVTQALNYAASVNHIMEHSDFSFQQEQIEPYATKPLLVAIVWAFTGDSKLDTKTQMGLFFQDHSGLDMPPLQKPGASLIDYDVQVSSGDWFAWQSSVPIVDIDTHQVADLDVVIPTLDTLSEMDVVGLNFSSATTPELVLKTFDQHCKYKKTSTWIILPPIQIGKWTVIFCHEINLPAADKYATQKRTLDKVWLKLEYIQFLGACNPPTDPGLVTLSQRLLRHAPLVMVDYPGEASLKQIYGAFNQAVLKVLPSLCGHAEPLTSAMVKFYLSSQKRFMADGQAHYVYSPWELTRWVRGVYESRGDNTSKSGASLKLPSEMAYNRTGRKETQDTCVLLVAGREMEGIKHLRFTRLKGL
ncbi:hypothetical protein PPACK8108_LOCUS22525 [Phakopsora pachyrhizi]|uniref:Dynein heavy chain, cytoplasmic n=1 Tax=Phakopsora pachyrhizi TaxID=170000 RepID=A0AAV0BKW4_PHAPC|nr:hypothetical protein PPACK8108_LOCUS22525 [Phakopsora pachyrhizi]